MWYVISLSQDSVVYACLQSNRAALLQRCVQMNRSSAAASLLSADVAHKPFNMAELAFNVVQRPRSEIAVK